MQLEIRRGPLHLTPELEEYIHERGDFLKAFHGELRGCRVTLDGPVGHHRKGGPYEVHLDLHIPGVVMAVTKQRAEDLQTAIRMAFDAARRQLTDHNSTRLEQARAS